MQALCKLTNWAGLISGQCKSEDAPICYDSDSFQGILVFGPGTTVCVYHMIIGTWYVNVPVHMYMHVQVKCLWS